MQKAPDERAAVLEDKALIGLSAVLETVRERVDYAIGRLKSFEEVRIMRWRCVQCQHVKSFTRPVPAEAAALCPKCQCCDFVPHA